MTILADLVQQNTSTTGTGTVTLGSAVTGFRTVAGASIADGSLVSYAIIDGTNRETGTGVVGASGTTLTRVLRASTTGSLLNLTGSALVGIVANADDFLPDVYPASKFASRYQSWRLDPSEPRTLANNAGPFGNRYFLGQDNTVTWSRVLIPSGNGRAAIRRQVVNYSPAEAGYIRGQTGSGFILDIDAGAVWRWKARVNLRPNGQTIDSTTNRYAYICGFSAWTSPSVFPSNNAIFRYYYDSSGGQAAFNAMTRRNGIGQTTVLSANLIVDGFVTLEIVLSSTQVLFYVDDILRATHTTVPDGGALTDGDCFFRDGHSGTVIMDLAYMATSVSWGNDA